MTDEPLIHWGIPGMRWGIRRRASGQVMTSVRGKIVPAMTSVRGKPTPVIGGRTKSSDHSDASKLKKKHLSEMSNEELKKLTTRMQLEKQYKDLSKTDVSTGQKFVTEVLGNAGKQLAAKYIATAVEQGLPKLIKILQRGTH